MPSPLQSALKALVETWREWGSHGPDYGMGDQETLQNCADELDALNVDDGDLREAAQRVVDYWPDLPPPEYIGVGSIRERIEQLRAALARPALLTQTETEENDERRR